MNDLKFQPHIQHLINMGPDKLPRTIMLSGPKGCGKHLTLGLIQKVLSFDTINITENIDDGYLDELRGYSRPHIFYVDELLSIKQQNELLKFIEEPLNNSFIFILTQNKSLYLNTIRGRCNIFEFNNYSKIQLQTFIDSDILQPEKLLHYADTPGFILDNRYTNFIDIETLCGKILFQIGRANTGNIFKIHKSINLTNAANNKLIDINLFAKILIDVCYNTYLEHTDQRYFDMYKEISNFRYKILNNNLNNEYLLDNLLLRLKEISNASA